MKVDELLAADGDISPGVAAHIARHVEFLTPEEAGLELSALSLEKGPGDTVVAYSRHPLNIRFNWRELMIELGALPPRLRVTRSQGSSPPPSGQSPSC